MLKALPLVHFWSVLLLKEQMMTSVRKTLNMLVLSTQNRSISSEICLEKRSYWWSLPRKLPRNSREIGRFFHEFVPKNPVKLDFFFRDLSDALGYIKVQAWLLVFFFNWDSLVMDWDSWFFARWIPELTITICNKITVHFLNKTNWENLQCNKRSTNFLFCRHFSYTFLLTMYSCC